MASDKQKIQAADENIKKAQERVDKLKSDRAKIKSDLTGMAKAQINRDIIQAQKVVKKKQDEKKALSSEIAAKDKAAADAQSAEQAAVGTNALDANSEAGRAELRFQEQCYLIKHFKSITDYSVKNLKYNATTQIIGSHPAHFISRITALSDIDDLLKARPVDYAALVPKVTIFKVYPDTEKEVMLPFSTFSSKSSLENVFKTGLGRGDDVVLKSFSFDFRNNNVALAKRLVEVKVKLLFSDPNSLTKKRGRFRYLDLFLRGGVGSRNVPIQERKFEADYYRIKAVVGWQVPPNNLDVLSDKFRKRIKKAKTVMYLELRNYDLDFKENGMLEVTLDYTSFIEAKLKSPRFDVFSPGEKQRQEERKQKNLDKLAEEEKKQAEIASKATAEREKAEANDTSFIGKEQETKDAIAAEKDAKDNLEETRNEIRLDKSNSKMAKYKRILQAMNERIYGMDVPWEQIVAFQETAHKVKIASRDSSADQRAIAAGFKKERNEVPPKITKTDDEDPDTGQGYIEKVEKANAGPKDKKEGELKNALYEIASDTPVLDNTERINFFYYGDLLDAVILEGGIELAQAMQEEKLRILLGPATFFNYYTGRPEMVNLADIPISMKLFLEFFHNKIVKEDRDKYPLHSFLRDTINYLIIPALGERCFEDAGSHKLDMRVITAPGVNNGKQDRVGHNRITLSGISRDGEVLQIKNEYTPAKNMYNYVVVYVSSAKASSLRGNIREDHEKGIYHLPIGADRGLVKSVKFKKMKLPYVTEMMATRSRNSQGDEAIQLWNPFNANLSLIGNAIFKPGQQLYIDVTSPMGRHGRSGAQSPARILGLGGYYIVTAANNLIDDSGWTTDVEAIWQTSGDGDEHPMPVHDYVESELDGKSGIVTQTMTAENEKVYGSGWD